MQQAQRNPLRPRGGGFWRAHAGLLKATAKPKAKKTPMASPASGIRGYNARSYQAGDPDPRGRVAFMAPAAARTGNLKGRQWSPSPTAGPVRARGIAGSVISGPASFTLFYGLGPDRPGVIQSYYTLP
jgi:hypothetical protein